MDKEAHEKAHAAAQAAIEKARKEGVFDRIYKEAYDKAYKETYDKAYKTATAMSAELTKLLEKKP